MELDDTYGNLAPLAHAPVPHSRSHSLESLGAFDLDLGNVVGVQSDGLTGKFADGYQVSSPPTDTVMDEATVEFFLYCLPFNCPSVYSKEALDLAVVTSYCSRGGGYIVHSPNATDRM